MIINTGQRTDIPAFYAPWFMNRVRAGFVLTRNPFNPKRVTRYRLDPDVVDALIFCTKNPAPLLPHLTELGRFRMFWFVTITPYGPEIEPGVPDKDQVIDSFRRLSGALGKNAVSWRYDPVFITDRYSLDFHREAFSRMASMLRGYTDQAVISFIDLYEKTVRNFPEARAVTAPERIAVAESFAAIAAENGMTVRSCFEGDGLVPYGINADGCLTQDVLERGIGAKLDLPSGYRNTVRPGCSCVMGSDIGHYNTCRHFCLYCYANYDRAAVLRNSALHDPESPLITGRLSPGDEVFDAAQESWISNQLSFDFL